MHTTASDGRLTPAELVARAAAARADDDQRHRSRHRRGDRRGDGGGDSRRHPRRSRHRDHGDRRRPRRAHARLFLRSRTAPQLSALLVSQRALRVSRVREIAARLASLNMPVDVEQVLLAAAARPGSSVGRPQLARELVRAGHVESVQQAFDRWLATGPPGVRAAHRAEPRGGDRDDSCRRRRRVVRASRRDQARRADRAAGRSRARCDRGLSLRSHARGRHRCTAAWRSASTR